MNARLLLACASCDDGTVSLGTVEGMWGSVVRVETSMGDFEIELFTHDAPVTTENFIRYVNDGFYDGLTMHRVIDNFMSQGGQYDEDMVPKNATYPPIANEADNGVKNLRGTVAMARVSDPQSATCQFFINDKDNAFLDHRDDTQQGYGYCVFGRIRSGMEVVDAINAVPTGPKNGFNDVPLTPVLIEKMTFSGFLGRSFLQGGSPGGR